jgi:hypothetical protein
VPGTPPSTVTSLTPDERGLVAGALALGAEKAAVDRVLGGERAAAAWAAVRDLARDQRAVALAELLRELLAPLPSGIEALHPSWLAGALAGEPAGLAAALRGTGQGAGQSDDGGAGAPWSLDLDARAQLARAVFGALEPLTEDPAGPLGAALRDLEPAALLAEVTRRGAQALGVSLAGAPLELRARAMASAGPPWADEVAAAAAQPADTAAREAARELVARAAAVPATTPADRLCAVGLLALAPLLAAEGPGSLRRVAGRLPAELGRRLLG